MQYTHQTTEGKCLKVVPPNQLYGEVVRKEGSHLVSIRWKSTAHYITPYTSVLPSLASLLA